MERIALFTIECFASSTAISRLIEQHHEKISLVVTTEKYQGKRGNFFKQLVDNYYRSGFDFVIYLFYNFIFYFWMIYLSKFISSFIKRPRKIFRVDELCQKYQIQHIKRSNVNSKEVLAALKKANLDLIAIYFFDQIVREDIIKIPLKGIINVHAALLPECKGLFPAFYSSLKGNSQFGITVHEIVDTSIDAGPVLAQQRVQVPPQKSILFLDKFVNDSGVDLVSRVIKNFDAYHQKRVVQTGGSYFSFPSHDNIQEAKSKGIRLSSLEEFWGEFL